MSLFGFVKRTVELPLSITIDVITSPKKILDNMCGEDVSVVPSTKIKLSQMKEEIDDE